MSLRLFRHLPQQVARRVPLARKPGRRLGKNLSIDGGGPLALAAFLQRDAEIESRFVEVRRLLDCALEPRHRVGGLPVCTRIVPRPLAASAKRGRRRARGDRRLPPAADLTAPAARCRGSSSRTRSTDRAPRPARTSAAASLRVPASACSRPSPFSAAGFFPSSASAACSALSASAMLPAARAATARSWKRLASRIRVTACR